MKFGKEFKSQMVLEWEEAYMNYDYLKTLLRDINQFRLKIKQPSPKGALKRTLTMYRSFSGLTLSRRWSSLRSPSTMDDGGDIEDQVILIHHEGSEEAVGYSNNLNQYQTKFLMSSDAGGEYELVYFRRLDDELNKVNTFYRGKVEEVMAEAALLTKQMDALIAFRLKVENPDGLYHSDSDWNIEMAQLASDVAASTASATISLAARTSPSNSLTKTRSAHGENNHERVRMDSIEEFDLIIEEHDSRNYTVAADTRPINTSNNSSIDGGETKPNKLESSRPACLKILNRVTINNTLETPCSTIKAILKVNKNNELTYGRENLRKVEEKLKQAFIEFYQKLRLLKSYSFMNLLAFSKIMKKYDKVASRNASRAYLKMVDNSYLGNTDATARLMERVEATFIKHFANANRSKGIRILRPKAKSERHIISFSTGLFAGCAGALLVALILISRARNILDHKGSTQYMDNMFPLYSLFGFMVLHMLMYAMNIYAWRRYRVNYQFIFGFKHGTELGYREVFLLSAGLATLALASVLANLDMEMDPKTNNYKTFTELVPLVLVGVIFAITICPLNIIYRSSRYFLLRCAYHCICAPFYKVLLPDFFLADQLTSQVQAIRSLEFYICYYGWGDFKLRQNTCTNGEAYKIFYFIIATIPYWCRFLQCLRRLFEERDVMQGYNALKYLSTIVAVLMRTAYSREKATGWWVMAWVFSVIAACVSIYWDLVVDWGLLQRRSKNRWLRDKLLVSHKSVYAVAMVLNVLLRFAWLQTMLNFQVSFLHKEALTAIVASLEIIRRGIWNFFRLENEHLNNVGKFRAFKSVPLPFNYDDDEDKDE